MTSRNIHAIRANPHVPTSRRDMTMDLSVKG